MSDLLQDVDDAMRVERMVRLWNEHKIALVTGIVALILGTSAHAAWNAWDAKQKRADTSALLTALDEKEPLPALEKLAAETNGQTLTLMTAAARAMADKKYPVALDLYKQVKADKKAPAVFRDLAIVQSVNLALDQDDRITTESLLEQIEPVAKDDKSPWQGQALMTRAVIKAHKSKDLKGAIGDLELVTAKQALPQSLRERAQALIDTYKLEGQS